MIRTLIGLASLLILGALTWLFVGHKEPPPIHDETDFANWHLYTAPSGQFQLFFPTLPQSASSKGFSTYISQHRDETTYMVNVIDSDDLAKAVQDMVSANKDNILKEQKTGTFKNRASIDFVIENGPTIVVGKAIKMGEHLYILTVMRAKGEIDPREYNFFINSFEPQAGKSP